MSLQANEDTSQSNPKSPSEPGSSLIQSTGDLLADLSIELRTPLNTMLGFASLLQDPFLSDTDKKHFVQRIIANGDHLLQVLDDALNFSKIQKGEVRIEKTEFSLAEMVHDIALPLKRTTARKGIDLLVTFKTAIPQVINSDPLKVRQVLTSFLGNAIRYAEGDGFILVSLSLIHREQDFVCVEIDDSGISPSTSHASREHELAELEAPLHPDMANRPGMTLSQEFARALGGEVVVQPSELGSGNIIQFLIPTGLSREVPLINRIKAPTIVERVIGSIKKEHRLENIRILLVEDSQDNADVIKLYLNKEGAKLAFAHNGLEAIDAVKKQEFDLILMDIQMPILDGLEATRQIRQLGFRKPIVALTGEALRDDAEKSLKAGCDSHISKPVRKEALIEEIQKRVFH